MRIVLVNWARIWDGASYGGGVNQYCQALALELVKRGHDVVSLFGGTSFVPNPPRCCIRRHDDWLGVKVFEVVNSPVMAPSIVQYEDPMGEVSAPELEEQVGRLFGALKPDVVHWNNIEGFSIGCIGAARKACSARHVFSLHNYHTICPQVYLMQGHKRTCYDFDNGHTCATCIEFKPRAEERLRHMNKFIAAHGADPKRAEEARHAWLGALGTIKRAATGYFEWKRLASKARGAEIEPPGAPVPLGGASGDVGQPVLEAHPPKGGDAGDKRGKTPHLLAEMNPWTPPPPDAPELQPLTNDIRPEPVSSKAPNGYGQRRTAMVGMLSSCDTVLAVSDFVRRKFVSMGVDQARIHTMPIGSRINRVVALKPDLVFDPPAFEPAPTPWSKQRPVRLHFMGYNNYYKGLQVVAEALEMMVPEHLRQIDLSIFALDGHRIEWMFRRLEPRLARLTFKGEYNYHDIPWMLGGKDLTLVPSVWWDNAPQTVFESHACGVPVLGADIGGIPDFVRDGHNGLLFTANSRASLKAVLIRAIENPHMLWGLRANVRPPRSIADHAVDIERVYAGEAPPPYSPLSPVEVRVSRPSHNGSAGAVDNATPQTSVRPSTLAPQP
ncbi:MAG TPA: glycosyltransferase [Phycisphaerales bacterium]|nr:glycosyltransferase [Phycisphaerales bacterium]